MLKSYIRLKLFISLSNVLIVLVFSTVLVVYLNSFNNSNSTYGQVQTERTANIVENDDLKGLINKGNSLDDLANFTGAIEYFDKALDIDPNDADSLYNKGLAVNQLRK